MYIKKAGITIFILTIVVVMLYTFIKTVVLKDYVIENTEALNTSEEI